MDEDEAINVADGKSSASGNDLLLYFHANTSTEVPFSGHERFTKLHRHHDNESTTSRRFIPSRSGSISSERNKIRIKFNDNFGDRQNAINTNQNQNVEHQLASADVNRPLGLDDNHHDIDSPPQLSSNNINSDFVTNLLPLPDAVTHLNVNHYHHQLTPLHRPPNHHRNRYHINQHRNEDFKKRNDERNSIESSKPSGVINDLTWMKTKKLKNFASTDDDLLAITNRFHDKSYQTEGKTAHQSKEIQAGMGWKRLKRFKFKRIRKCFAIRNFVL